MSQFAFRPVKFKSDILEQSSSSQKPQEQRRPKQRCWISSTGRCLGEPDTQAGEERGWRKVGSQKENVKCRWKFSHTVWISGVKYKGKKKQRKYTWYTQTLQLPSSQRLRNGKNTTAAVQVCFQPSPFRLLALISLSTLCHVCFLSDVNESQTHDLLPAIQWLGLRSANCLKYKCKERSGR